MRRLVALLLVSGVILGVSGCGKKGAPEAPGPGDRITYPKIYPTQ